VEAALFLQGLQRGVGGPTAGGLAVDRGRTGADSAV